MITEIELNKKYSPPNGGRALIFYSLGENGLYNYAVEGIKTFAPLFCSLQEALDMVNGNSPKWKVYP